MPPRGIGGDSTGSTWQGRRTSSTRVFRHERVVLKCLARDLLHKEVADELQMVVNAARTHVCHIHCKRHARNRTEAVVARLSRETHCPSKPDALPSPSWGRIPSQRLPAAVAKQQHAILVDTLPECTVFTVGTSSD